MEWDNVYQNGKRLVAYVLDKEERQMLIEAFNKKVKKLEAQIEKLESDPKNEGQATFSIKIDNIYRHIKNYREGIHQLETHSDDTELSITKTQ